MHRFNEIVNHTLDVVVIKSWGSGMYDKVDISMHRMIAVCWVLVNKHDCSIKERGFIRDYAEVSKLSGVRKDLLVHDSYTNFYKIKDDHITPSDIDVDLSSEHLFVY